LTEGVIEETELAMTKGLPTTKERDNIKKRRVFSLIFMQFHQSFLELVICALKELYKANDTTHNQNRVDPPKISKDKICGSHSSPASTRLHMRPSYLIQTPRANLS
jgi:hypothetical protein